MTRIRTAAMLITFTLIAAACAGVAADNDTADGSTTTSPTAAPTTTPPSSTVTTAAGEGTLPQGPSALRDRTNPAFPPPLIDPADILSGGPPPDGIPSIDNPEFVTVEQADAWLDDAEPVLAVEVNGDVRAYPIQILIWHEIVNDTVGGIPLSITYCPLCNSGITFIRTVRGVETTFGTSGSLYFANLVMYDRATESLWNQLDGTAVVGVLTGDVLDQIPSPMVAWSDFKKDRPDAQVLDRERTGFDRRYGTNPYTGLDNPDGQPYLFRGDVDTRARAMQRVVALESGGQAYAWTLDAISGDGPTVTTGEASGDPLVIFWKPGQASALESSAVSGGRDVGTVGVFSPIVDGQTLTFRGDGDGFVDDETGSTWTVLGDAIDGPMAGSSLTPITFVRTFWFSWAAFRPETTLIGG